MKIDFNRLKEDYLPTMEDDDAMLTLKKAVFSLTEAEQRILLMYSETGSYSEVARQFNVSAPTVKKYIDIIREKIKKEL